MEEDPGFLRRNLLYKYLGDVEPYIKRYYWVAIICGVVLWYGWLPSGWVKASTWVAFIPTLFVALFHFVSAYNTRREERQEIEERKSKKNKKPSNEDTVISLETRRIRAAKKRQEEAQQAAAKKEGERKEQEKQDHLDFTQVQK